jgi:hypothetical protein
MRGILDIVAPVPLFLEAVLKVFRNVSNLGSVATATVHVPTVRDGRFESSTTKHSYAESAKCGEVPASPRCAVSRVLESITQLPS